MANLIISVLAIITLCHTLRNLDGPFGSFNYVRNILLNNKFVGVFFYQLLNCPWCFGFHCGYFVYLLQCNQFKFSQFILWGLVGSAVGALFEMAQSRHEE